MTECSIVNVLIAIAIGVAFLRIAIYFTEMGKFK